MSVKSFWRCKIEKGENNQVKENARKFITIDKRTLKN
jgi:hypothetical protein